MIWVAHVGASPTPPDLESGALMLRQWAIWRLVNVQPQMT
jgi:hypothetical protein